MAERERKLGGNGIWNQQILTSQTSQHQASIKKGDIKCVEDIVSAMTWNSIDKSQLFQV